jgi:hypothetical protein
MTEAEWLASDNASAMIEARYPLFGPLPATTSERKLRLFTTACCRRIWHLLPDDLSREAVEVAERFADGAATEPERAEAGRLASEAYYSKFGSDGRDSERYAAAICLCQPHGPGIRGSAAHAASEIPGAVGSAVIASVLDSADPEPAFPRWPADKSPVEVAERVASADLLRDIIGNPFRPVTFSPSWRTDTALTLARTMYEAREFGAMPILADALQDAGCDNDDILAHCRGDRPHVRGCWVVDLVLGKC